LYLSLFDTYGIFDHYPFTQKRQI